MTHCWGAGTLESWSRVRASGSEQVQCEGGVQGSQLGGEGSKAGWAGCSTQDSGGECQACSVDRVVQAPGLTEGEDLIGGVGVTHV